MKLAGGVIILGLLLLISTTHVRAANGTAITSLSATIKLQSDGQAFVEQVLEFTEPTTLNWSIFSNIRGLSVSADDVVLARKDIRKGGRGGQAQLTSPVTASQWVIDYTATTNLIRHDNRDQLYFKLFEEPGRQIYNSVVSIELPAGSTATDHGSDGNAPVADLSGDLYAITGVLSPSFTKQSESQILYSAIAAGPQAIFTASASWSADLLPLGWYHHLRLQLLDLELTPWLVIGFLLPLISLLVLAEIYWRLKRDERPVATVLNQPPSLLPPVLVGVLVNKKIYPNEIVAQIVDLAQKGYIVIVKKNQQYSLSRRKTPDGHLQIWERDILTQIFPVDANAAADTSRSLYSPEVRDAFARIYQVITDLRIFSENPHLTRVRYKLIALFFYYLSAVGLVTTAVFGLSPFVLIPFTGTMIISFLIIRLSPRLIRYTPAGLQARAAWLAFANFLRTSAPVPMEASQNHLFENYLAYAVALHATEAWADRFEQSSLAIIKPDWLVSYQETSTSQLVEEITAFTSSLSKELTNLRGPIVG